MKHALVLLVVLLMVPAVCLGQAKPGRFVGDDSSFSPHGARDRLNFQGSRSSSNVGGVTDLNRIGNLRNAAQDVNDDGTARPPIRYKVLLLDALGNPVLPTQLVDAPPLNFPISAEDWTKFVRDHRPRTDFTDVDFNAVDDTTQTPRPEPLSFDAPRNRVAVIDQGVRKDRIDAGQPPEVTSTRLVTIVTRWVDAIPIYAQSCVTAYPCCCTQCFSYITGYNYVPRSETRYEYRAVADYPSTEIAMDRGIVLVAGNPKYSTQVPRLCEFHYGAGATLNLPTVPLATDINDIPATTRTATTVTVSGGVTTEITAPMMAPLVEGSQPVGTGFGGLTLPAGRRTGLLTTTGSDRGTNTFSGDSAIVADVVAKGTPGRPFSFTERTP